MNLTYRPSDGDPNELENHFKKVFSKQKITNERLVLVGNFNFVDFNESRMAQNFVILMFWHSLIPTVNKPAHVTIDRIITKSVINAEFKTNIIKLTNLILFQHSFYLNVLLIVPRPGKNSYTNKITPVIQ